MQNAISGSMFWVTVIVISSLVTGWIVFCIVVYKLKTDIKQLFDGAFLQIFTVLLTAVITGMLTLAGALPAEGTLSILSGIIGYVLGTTRKGKKEE